MARVFEVRISCLLPIRLRIAYKGGHNFFQIRISDNPVMASRDGIDIIVALDKESIRLHRQEISENGLIIYDTSIASIPHPP
jgi:Pyruvate/2-oxoacid:ferredoxin oxidoreductase gamma subunit